MTVKVLPILNAAGCLFLVGFIFVQWKGGQDLQSELHEARKNEILAKNEKVEIEKRTFQLQSDVDGLKASVESINKTAEEAEKALAEKSAQADALNTGLTQAQDQFKQWEEAIKARDAKIGELNTALVATRKRLDEAIAKLKEAGAR